MGRPRKAWYRTLPRRAGRQRDLRFWPDAIGDPVDIAYACVWRAPHGLLAELPNLKAIFNLGAGVDHLLADPSLPDVPIARAVHPDLSMRMTEYVVLHVLMHHRRQRIYDAQQRERVWQGHDQPAASEVDGRHHGARRDRARCRRGAAPDRVSGRRLEPHARSVCPASRCSTD